MNTMSVERKTQRSNADWEAVHAEYRAGLLSLREIALEHHVSHTAIRKRAARGGWRRDLMARIKAKAEALVSRAEVSSEVSTELAVGEQAIVDSNAQVVAGIRLLHRQEIARLRALAMAMLDDLQAISADGSLVERLSIAVARDAGLEPKETQQCIAVVRNTFSLSSRARMMKSLIDTLAKLIALEREAYDLDSDLSEDKGTANDWLAEVLRQIEGAV